MKAWSELGVLTYGRSVHDAPEGCDSRSASRRHVLDVAAPVEGVANLERTVRTGEFAFESVFGMPNFDDLRTNSGEAELFNRIMQHSPDDRHAAVVAAYDFATHSWSTSAARRGRHAPARSGHHPRRAQLCWRS